MVSYSTIKKLLYLSSQKNTILFDDSLTIVRVYILLFTLCIIIDMEYKSIDNLEIYKISLELSKYWWKLYKQRDFSIRKIIWDQFIRAIDSIGANISEWFGRFHYMDSVKFYYNARWSLFEAKYWVKLLHNRGFIAEENSIYLGKDLDTLWVKLNNFIKYIKEKKTHEQ